MSPATRTWLVTGASSGFGRAVAEVALRNHENVVATCRNPAALSELAAARPSNLLVLQCDVTKQADIATAFSRAVQKFGSVDVVLNSAGTAAVGEIEATPEDVARAIFDVNVWGSLNVSKEAVRVFRDVNPNSVGGRHLNVSSRLGIGGGPTCGIYAASKHAVEGFTESLALELNPAWNIKVSLIAPGAFKTGMHDRIPVLPAPAAYSDPGMPSQMVRQWFKDGSGIRGDPLLLAEEIFKFSALDAPAFRWAVGKDSIGGTRAKLEKVAQETDAFASWSENLEIAA